MRYLKKVFVLLLCLFVFASPLHVQAQENFNIDNYSVEIQVNEDGSLNVHEKIDMTFTDYVHGFYRNIPIKYNMNWGDMGKKTYYFPVYDIEVLNEPYEVDSESDGVQIKIGDPDEYVYGPKTYDIRYTIQTRDLGIDQDYFYYNLIGFFDCQIQHVDFSITFPKPVDASTLDIPEHENVVTEMQGNVIRGETLSPLYNYQSLTIYLELGKNYFDFVPIADHTNMAMIVCAVILVVCILLYLKFGRKTKPLVTVEFNAPKGLSSAGVGYVIDGEVNTEDVLSLIIDFANRGYITIYDGEEDTSIKKIKDIDPACAGYERTFFNALFKEGEEVSLKELQERHFGDQIRNTKEMIFNYFHLKENKIYSNGSLTIQIVMTILAGLALGLLTSTTYYHQTGMIDLAILPLIILWPLLSASMIFWIILSRKRHVYSNAKTMLISTLACIIHLILLLVSLIFLKENIAAFIFVTAYTIAMAYMIATSGKRSAIGNRWLGQILGLKDFIMEAEQDRLEMLAEEDPSYFYHILPYAYVLGISDVWSKKFESINIPSPVWYSSYDASTFTTVLWMSHFHATMHSFDSLASAITPPSSSSGGFGGGGFSGGGFSGGGFGGGGGGSW